MPNYQRKTPSLLKSTGLIPYLVRTCEPTVYLQPRFSLNPNNFERSKKRLYSAEKYNQIDNNKFKRLNTSKPATSWNKWKLNGFPDVTKQLRKKLTDKIKRSSFEIDDRKPMGNKQLKLRLKIREVMKLKTDISHALETNHLIKLIEDSHESKINHFFDDFQEYISRKP